MIEISYIEMAYFEPGLNAEDAYRLGRTMHGNGNHPTLQRAVRDHLRGRSDELADAFLKGLGGALADEHQFKQKVNECR